MITHPVSGSNPETNTVILMDDASATVSASEHATQCCTSSNLMCEADRFFQAGVSGDGLENAGTRETESLPTPKSP